MMALIYRDFKILMKEKFYILAPLFLFAGLIGDYACYILAVGYIMSIIANNDFKYNGDVLMNILIENRTKFVVGRFLSKLLYIPAYGLVLFVIKVIMTNLIDNYCYVFNVGNIVTDICIAICVLSIMYFLMIKFGVECSGFIFTILVMAFSALEIFQKDIDLYSIKHINIWCILVSFLSLYICIKIYKNRDF